MSEHAIGTFQIASWDEKTYEQLDGDAKLTHARIRQDFAGDLEGNGTWEVLMCYAADGTAVYKGFVRVRGRLANKTGTAVLQTDGGFDGSEARWTWSVVPGSGTDQWLGLRGKGTCAAPHGSTGSFTLDFDLNIVETGADCAVRVPDARSELT